ncbi:uncharacterized protein LOC127455946 [Myxocyprinus asiaticus]|uniref:uncharacterized protein LOC127455946 n=1 Tax=Myxocyprinus asiaticus TaxID=70543 RepID=UPI002221B438|nr:uncharacterized protein LOC127455946 [Myxocyprinus asiaticus]
MRSNGEGENESWLTLRSKGRAHIAIRTGDYSIERESAHDIRSGKPSKQSNGENENESWSRCVRKGGLTLRFEWETALLRERAHGIRMGKPSKQSNRENVRRIVTGSRSDLESRPEKKRERESPERVTFPACRVCSHNLSLFYWPFFPRFFIPLCHEKTHSSQEQKRGHKPMGRMEKEERVREREREREKERERRRNTSSAFEKKTMVVAIATV